MTSLGDDIQRSRVTLRSTKNVELTSSQQFGEIIDLARNRLTAIEDIAEAGTILLKVCQRSRKRSPTVVLRHWSRRYWREAGISWNG